MIRSGSEGARNMNSKQYAEELRKAWYDYCITDRLIAYGDPDNLTEEEIEKRCRKQYEKKCEKLRRKYESISCKS